MIQTIVVPLDCSKLAEAALPQAINLAQKSGATIHLLSIIPPLTYSEVEAMSELGTTGSVDEVEEVATYLNSVKESLSHCRVEKAIRKGNPAEEIMRYARSIHANMIMMATHGRTGLTRLLTGSVAGEVIQKSGIPVLLARKALTVPNYNRILIPLDGGIEAELVVPEAINLAHELDMEIILMRVVRPQEMLGVAYIPGFPLTDPQPQYIDEEPRAHAYLHEIAKRVKIAGVPVETLVVIGSPASAINTYVSCEGVDIIAMATHARHGLNRLIYGSVAEAVLTHTDIPLFMHCIRRSEVESATKELAEPA